MKSKVGVYSEIKLLSGKEKMNRSGDGEGSAGPKFSGVWLYSGCLR